MQEPGADRLTMEHRYTFDCNIVRGLWSNRVPAPIYEKRNIKLSGWGERATMWSRQYKDHIVGEYDQEIAT